MSWERCPLTNLPIPDLYFFTWFILHMKTYQHACYLQQNSFQTLNKKPLSFWLQSQLTKAHSQQQTNIADYKFYLFPTFRFKVERSSVFMAHFFFVSHYIEYSSFPFFVLFKKGRFKQIQPDHFAPGSCADLRQIPAPEERSLRTTHLHNGVSKVRSVIRFLHRLLSCRINEKSSRWKCKWFD